MKVSRRLLQKNPIIKTSILSGVKEKKVLTGVTRYPTDISTDAKKLRAKISCNLTKDMTDVYTGYFNDAQYQYPYWQVWML